jgi:feruloyl esterase
MPVYKFTNLLLLAILIVTSGSRAQQANSFNTTQPNIQQQDSLANILRQKILQLHLPGITVTNIQFIQPGSYTPKATGKELADLPAFCLVVATLQPTVKSEIKIEVWLPQHNWNGRLLGTGNGGGGGSISYGSLAEGIRQGYATTNNDMGTSRGGANAAVDNPEEWTDFGYRATHEMTVAAKAILQAYYGKAQHHAYFTGCSTGGQQALMEAQKFPGDYNGIIAGAPANNRTHLHTGFLLNYMVTNKGNKPLFSADELSFITRRIVTTYSLKTGSAPGDNFLTDPRMIHVDFDLLFRCRNGNKDTCLSDDQVSALKAIYAGPVNPKTHEHIYTSPPVGSENVSGGLVYQETANGVDGLFYPFKWVFGKDFDNKTFDFNKDMARMDAVLAPVVNANNPDLEPLKKKGGKIIMYTGTADPLVPYQDALNYYERVVSRQRGLQETQKFFRYFLIPGMGHCSGGPGLNGFNHNILTDLVAWVENGKAPDQVLASGIGCCSPNGPVRFQRPVFPYPKFPTYIGGDVKEASSYIGVEHKRNGVIKPAYKYLR